MLQSDAVFAEWVAGVVFAGRDCRESLARLVRLATALETTPAPAD